MSVWGADAFENDDAADWVTELENEPSIERLLQAVDELADPVHVGYIEIPECCVAVAAAEFLARLISGSRNSEPLSQESWSVLSTEMQPYGLAKKRKMANLAYHAVDRVLRDSEGSELEQHWTYSHLGYDVWATAMKDLLDRLDRFRKAPLERGS